MSRHKANICTGTVLLELQREGWERILSWRALSPNILSLKRDSFSADFDGLHTNPQCLLVNLNFVQINTEGEKKRKKGGERLSVQALAEMGVASQI